MKGSLVRLVNRPLSLVGAKIVATGHDSNEPGHPSVTALRLRLFNQLARKGLRPRHIVDVGAHKAHWSRDAHLIFPDAAYTLIEPQAEMKPDIDRFCADAKNAKWIMAGAGSTNGEMAMTIAPRPDSSSFATPATSAQTDGLERRTLPVVTLDSVCKDSGLPAPTIVKIDAEGLDLDVMLGAQSLLGVTELFFLELPLFDYWPNQSFHGIVGFMKERGYEPYDITDLNRRSSDDALALMEFAFAKRDGVLRDKQGW